MIKFVNSLSLQMFKGLDCYSLDIEKIDTEEVITLLSTEQYVSYIGHKNFALVLSDILGNYVPFNRDFALYENGDTFIVAQLIGGRLPEGATTLPSMYSVEFFKVTVKFSKEAVK